MTASYHRAVRLPIRLICQAACAIIRHMNAPRRIAVKLTPNASSERVGGTRMLPGGEEQLLLYVTATQKYYR